MEYDNSMDLNSGLIVIKFWAEWCAPCKRMTPIFSILEKEFENIKFLSVNIDENKDIAKKYGIKSIPTLILLKNGTEVNRVVGITLIEPLRTMFRKFNEE